MPEEVTPTAPILELTGVNKSFGVVHVLHDVDFKVYPGEVTALVGDNGAGKSTLVKAIAGIHPIDSGIYLFEGKPVTVHGPNDVAALGVEVVYQDLALCDNLDIVSSLSGGQRQTVAIAKCVLWNSRVVLLDEPTAALGVAQTRQVIDLVRRLADQGLGVVLISHNMVDVFEVADRICALYLGRVAAEVKASEVTHGQVVELITAGRSGNLGLAPAEAAQSM